MVKDTFMTDYLSMASEAEWASSIPQFKNVRDNYRSEKPLNQQAISKIRKEVSALLDPKAVTPVRPAHHYHTSPSWSGLRFTVLSSRRADGGEHAEGNMCRR